MSTNLSPYEFFRIYHSIDLHFTSKYDFFKYRGKTKPIPHSSFIRRPDYQRFVYYARRVDTQQACEDYCVSNFAYRDSNGSSFIYSDVDVSDSIYKKYVKTKDSLSQTFKEDLQYILQSNTIIKSIKSFDLLRLSIDKKVNIETVIILNRIYMKFLEEWKNETAIDPYLNSVVNRYIKFSPFVTVDLNRIIQIIIGELNGQHS